MGTGLESNLAEGVLSAVGNPIYAGLLVLGFFAGFVILQNTSFPLKATIVVAACFLAAAYIPFLGLIAALVSAVILYAGAMRVIGK